MTNIKKARLKSGLSQKEIAITLNVAQPSVSSWEAGRKIPMGKNLLGLSKLLGVSTDYLLGKTENTKHMPSELSKQVAKSIKINLEKVGKSKTELAEFLSVSKDLVDRWVSGIEYPTENYINEICIFFGIHRNELFSGTSLATAAIMEYLAEAKDYSNSRDCLISDSFIRLPVFEEIPYGSELDNLSVIDFEDVPAAWGRNGAEFFGLKVKGNQMYPKYLEGDTIIVRKTTHFSHNQDCVLCVGSHAAILQTIQRMPDGSITLRPINVSYPPRTYTQAEQEQLPIIILGIVVELRRPISEILTSLDSLE